MIYKIKKTRQMTEEVWEIAKTILIDLRNQKNENQ